MRADAAFPSEARRRLGARLSPRRLGLRGCHVAGAFGRRWKPPPPGARPRAAGSLSVFFFFSTGKLILSLEWFPGITLWELSARNFYLFLFSSSKNKMKSKQKSETEHTTCWQVCLCNKGRHGRATTCLQGGRALGPKGPLGLGKPPLRFLLRPSRARPGRFQPSSRGAGCSSAPSTQSLLRESLRLRKGL